MLSSEQIGNVRATYHKGMRIMLINMDDNQAPPKGTLGTVRGVDDAGSILVEWDTGSRLNVLPGIDEIVIIKE